MTARTRTDWVLRGALACTLIGTAHAEYTLAVATGVHPWVAACVPGALDLYVIRALQVRRDVFLAVLVMCAVNVASHLVTAGVLAVDWALISAVGALAPLVLWRVHALWHTRTRKELLWDVPAGTRDLIEAGQVAPAPAEVHPAPIQPPTPAPVDERCTHGWPADWDCTECTPSTPAEIAPAPAPPATSAPAPDPEPAPETAPTPVEDDDSDAEFMDAARTHWDDVTAKTGAPPSARSIKAALSVGQTRATRIRTRLLNEYTEVHP
ncbi:hypothetical protein ABZ621_36625 [Streptomyces sp. NPDC007863]|uniref:hypothetical protein n=1 Tax=Streptomyces sp. NPDC007863 TaxID=3154894 RepID=UPI0033E990C8